MLAAPLLTALMLIAALPAAMLDGDTRVVGRIVIEQRVVVRVPRLAPSAAAATRIALPRPVTWVESKGPKCIALATLAGALVTRPDSVDLVSAGGGRVRAHLDDDCPALDFYSGFYLKPTRDGRICADRDAVRSRAGRKCGIDKFARLVPAR